VAVISQIKAGQRLYTTSRDALMSYRAIVGGTVRDEITGQPLTDDFNIKVEQEGLRLHILGDGNFGLSGDVQRVFPRLDANSYQLDLLFNAPGYLDAGRTVFIPQQSSFPINLPLVQLRRLPVRLQGRMVKDTTARAPIAGAKLISVLGPTPAERNIILRTPLHFEHNAGVTVRECQFTPALTTRSLMVRADAGMQTITVNQRTGLAASVVLRIGTEREAEYVVIVHLPPQPADLNQPGEVVLTGALKRSFALNALVQPVTPAFPVGGLVRQLARETNAGDGVLILDGDMQVDAVEIQDPAAAKLEYIALGALTDEDGYYRLDGVGRVRALDLDASAAGFLMLPTVAWTINYEQPVNILNFRLSP
jgi:hypothetical protein